MTNSFKFNSSTTEPLSLRKGNIYIGVGDVGKGPTSLTGFKASPSFGTASTLIGLHRGEGVFSWYRNFSDSELISRTNRIDTSTVRTTKEQCFSYFAGQLDKIVLNREYESIVTDGLVLNLDAGFLPSYPETGTTWNDLSGQGNNGTLENGPTFDSGNGGSIVFDGSNDYVIGDTNLGISGNTSFSICYWARWDGVTFSSNFPSGVGNNSTGSSNRGLSTTWLSGRIALDFWVNRFRANTALNVQTWYYVSFTKTQGLIGTTSKLYANSIELSGAVEGSNVEPNIIDSPFIVGRLDGSRWFNGKISQVKIYNRALSASEILQNYNATKDRYTTTTTTTSTTTLGGAGQGKG